MNKLTSIKIKKSDGSYSDQILISVKAENIIYDDVYNIVDVLDALSDRINNIVTSETLNSDAELIEIRTGADNKTYTSAAEAVRENDKKAREVVLVQSSQPIDIEGKEKTWNKLWVDTSDLNEIEVPTMDEFDDLKNQFNDITDTTKNLFKPENVIDAFINSNQVIATSQTSKLVYAECEPNTTYTVSKAAGTRFSVAYINETLALNVSIHGRSNDYTGTSITITTGASAQYIVAWVYSGGTDSTIMTAEEMLATVQIEEGSSATEYALPYSAKDLKARENLEALEEKAFQLKSLTSGTNLNDIISENGYYILALNSTYENDPIGTGTYRFLRVFKSASSPTYTIQIMYGIRSGKTYSRNYASNTWSDWASLSDNFISMQEFCGATATRTYCDHGGFFIWGNSTLENGLYENSPEAFKRARRAGVMCQNMDIVYTSDGVPIVMHDYQKDDVNGETFIFGQRTLAEIQATTFGDSEYSWTIMTLKEGVDLAIDLGRTYTIDVHGGTYNPTGSVETLTTYMINNGIKPLSLVTSNTTTFNRLLNCPNIEDFPLGIVITSSEENNTTAIRNKIDLIKNAKNNLGIKNPCLAVTYTAYAYTDPTKYWFTPYVEECLQAGLSLSCYTINSNAQISNPIPAYFDRVTSDRYNVPYERYIRTISS